MFVPAFPKMSGALHARVDGATVPLAAPVVRGGLEVATRAVPGNNAVVVFVCFAIRHKAAP